MYLAKIVAPCSDLLVDITIPQQDMEDQTPNPIFVKMEKQEIQPTENDEMLNGHPLQMLHGSKQTQASCGFMSTALHKMTKY